MRFGESGDRTEQVVPLDLSLVRDGGAPLPHLIQGEGRAFLAFYLLDEDPEFAWIGVIEWLECAGAVLGGLNDEAISGHPLWSDGLDNLPGQLFAAEVIGSRWISEWEQANSVHEHHDPTRFESRRHFILLFHDSTFECVARGFVAYRTTQPLKSVVGTLAERLIDGAPLDFVVVASQRPE